MHAKTRCCHVAWVGVTATRLAAVDIAAREERVTPERWIAFSRPPRVSWRALR
eukprot:COSAG02_NODE_51320_length_315_cov_0.365741_1_plen_52_part_01